MSFFQTTEFYVILFLVAMAIVAFMAIPHQSAPATEYLLGSTLSNNAKSNKSDRSDQSDSSDSSDWSDRSDKSGLPAPAAIAVDCDDSGTVWLRRTGLRGVDATGAVSAKILVKGFNITVIERIVEGRYGDNPMDTALFEMDFLASERYWLRYESESTNSAATLSFRNTPGYHASAELRQ